MFKGGNGKGQEDLVNSPDKLNKIVEGTYIKGDIKTDSNFRIDGELVGTLDAMGKLVIGVNGKIEGDIRCGNADIEGEVIGNITVDGLLSLKATAKVTGNIVTTKIEMHNGVQFDGNSSMNGTKSSKPAPAPVVEKEESELVY